MEPDLVVAEMEAFLQDATDPEAVFTARYALGMAERSRSNLDEAAAILRAVGDDAIAAGFEQLGGRALLSYSGALGIAGRLDEAIEAAEEASTHLTGADLAAARVQVATFHTNREQHDEALAAYDAAIAVMETEPGGAARLTTAYHNRALTLVGLYRYAEAYDSLVQAYGMLEHEPDQRGRVVTHLGWLAALRGDIVGALRWFEELQDPTMPGRRDPGAKADYATALLLAGLTREAAHAAREAVALAERHGEGVRLGQAHTIRAAALLELGRVEGARRSAEAAAAAYRSVGAEAYQADLLLARILLRDRGAARLDEAVDLVEVVWSAGHLRRVAEVMLEASIRLAEAGRSDDATVMLDRVGIPASATDEVLTTTAQAWIASANGESTEARRVLAQAASQADEYRSGLGATDLRASSAIGREAVKLGLRMAIEDQAPDEAFAWAERFRATAQRRRPVMADKDNDLLVRYRQLMADPSAGDGERRDLEQRIAERARLAAGSRAVAAVGLPDLQHRLDDARFVELFETDGRWWALVIDADAAELVELDGGDLPRRLDALDVALGRLLRRPDDDAAFERIVQDLDARFVEPWRREASRVIVSPVGLTTAIPWAALPSLVDASMTVTPAATVWCRSQQERRAGMAAIAGPDLEHADREAVRVAAAYPNADVLVGPTARVDAALDALGSVGVAHIAAHGTLRSDNPLLSSVRLADGPLNVYDIERLDATPATVVLSACSVGTSTVTSGANTIGLATSFLAMGTSEVAAALFEVDDEATVEVMTHVHGCLADGHDLPASLALARTELTGAASVAARSFLVYG